ncbi:MAG: hypothetical protein ACJAUV_001200 [Flavobacteriales bacterium]|jgi:hypothetical protein
MNFLQLTEIEGYLVNPTWVEKTMVQINKDLTMIGMPAIEEPLPDSGEKLAILLAPYFDNIIQYKPKKWAEFLYRVDIPENWLYQSEPSENNDIPVMAYLIVKREMFKVFVREKYSGK